jgi:putative adenylate-forming enzyme
MKTNRLAKLPMVLGALRGARELESHDGWSRAQLADFQRERLLALVRDAATHSPFYRESLAGIELSDDLDPTVLPTLDKATMVDRFDDIVTDRRLTLTGIEQHLAEIERDSDTAPLLGEYVAMVSGGTGGQRGVFVHSQREWMGMLSGLLRWSGGYLGLGPRLPRRRIATIVAEKPLHSSGRMAFSIDVGIHRQLRLDARTPIPELVAALNAFQPEAFNAYPSIAALLAEEQIAGRLRIAPEKVSTSSEVRTAEMEERIVRAWGRDPFNFYATTETGFVAADCDRHAGLHLFDELVYFEVVDDDGRPVPPGLPGSRVLVTNLINRTQPLIRFEMTDLVTVSPNPCPCGRPYPLLEAVDGRSDDVLDLPAVGGGTIPVHPLTIRSPMAGIPALREYRVVLDREGINVQAAIATSDEDRGAVCAEIESRLREALGGRGVELPPLTVVPVTEIPRDPVSGKHRLVESRLNAPAPA